MGTVAKMIVLLSIWCGFFVQMINAYCNFPTYTWQNDPNIPPSSCGKDNKVFVGGTFEVNDIHQCEDACRNTYTCWVFTYNEQYKTCGLRTFSPQGQIDLPGTKIGRKYQGYLPSCDNKVFVGKALTIASGNSGDCQSSCQSNTRCKSWTWKGVDELCVHNYEPTPKEIPVNPLDNIVSGPKNCRGVFFDASPPPRDTRPPP